MRRDSKVLLPSWRRPYPSRWVKVVITLPEQAIQAADSDLVRPERIHCCESTCPSKSCGTTQYGSISAQEVITEGSQNKEADKV